MKFMVCMALIVAACWSRRLWIWGGKIGEETSPALAIAGRLGRTWGVKRGLWRNRLSALGVQALLAVMILLVGLPSPQVLACACSEVVIGTAATRWNDMSVDNTDGSLNLSQSDIYVPGANKIVFSRHYWSNDPSWGPFGEGWSFNFDNYVISAGTDVVIYMRGVQQTFVAANGYANAKSTLKLSYIGATEVKVEDRLGNSWYFDLTTSEMTSSFDINGNETDYTWKTVTKQLTVDGGGSPVYATIHCPLTVTYEDGRQLLFTYSTTAGQTYLCNQVETTSSGFTVSYSYTNGLLTGISKANGQTLAYGYYSLTDTYKTQGWLTSITYANGATVHVAYNGNYGSLTSPLEVTGITGPNGYSHSYAYSESGDDSTTTQTDGLGNATRYAYSTVTTTNIAGAVTNVVSSVTEVDTDALTHTATIQNNANRVPVQITDKRGNTISLVYDTANADPLAQRNILSATNQLGKVKSFSYDGSYNPTNSVDALGHTRSWTYDGFHRVTSAKNGLGQVMVTNTYTGYGQLATTANGAGDTTTFGYDGHGYSTNAIDPAGKSWSATYDNDGNRLTATDPLGHTATYTYDQFYKMATLTNALGKVTSFTRDSMADLTQVQDANGNTTSTTYDQLQRPTSITNALGKATTFAYNVEGNTTSLTDAKTNSYGYTYDALNRTKTFVYPDSSQESYAYDPNGNLTSVTNRASQAITRTYDVGNRLTAKTWQGTGGKIFTYGYDDANKLTSVLKTDGGATNSAIGYAYNAANQIVTNTVEGRAITYQYDSAQRISQIAYPSGAQANYAYESRDKLLSIKDISNSQITGYAYDDAGRTTKKTFANGLEDDYTYDAANRVTQIVLRQTSNPANVVQSFSYGYDDVGNRLWIQYKNGTGDVYQYDATYQVTGVKYGVSNPTAGYASATGATRTVTYAYDDVGNRTSVVDSAAGTTNYTANNLNQYASAGSTSYTYDTAGNLSHDATCQYLYDHEGHLTQVSKNGGGEIINYTYDAQGRRIRRIVGDSATQYVYDGDNLIEERNNLGTVTAKYIYEGGIDHPVQAIIGANTYYFQQDALGNITALTDSSGNLVEQYSYDIYGKPTIKDGSDTVLTTAKTPFLFNSREYEADAGFYHYRARVYSPDMGRFFQPDPISFRGGDVNVYRYCENNPINYSDPNGTFFVYFITGVLIAALIYAGIHDKLEGLPGDEPDDGPERPPDRDQEEAEGVCD